MSKNYRGPMAWFKRWNFKRVERRRWYRELLESIPATDAALLEGMTALLERSTAKAVAQEAEAVARDTEATAQAVWQAKVERKLEAVAALLERSVVEAMARDAEVRNADAAARSVWQASVEQKLEAMGTRVGALGADTFPILATARTGLLPEPELELIAGLAPWLSNKVALDVGAHHGAFSEALLDVGFLVHALEPNPTTCDELERRLGARAGFFAHRLAAGSADGEADLALVSDPTGNYIDPSQFASLSGLVPPPGLVASGTVRVKVRRLDGLVKEFGIEPPSFIKVDAEGTDLEVMRGLGSLRPAMLQVEFWDEAMPFSGPGATNRVPDLVAQARQMGLPWHLVVFRRWGDDRPAFYSGRVGSPEQSWGNVLFFADQALQERARLLLSALAPEARFVAVLKS
jgi:FkbM family methyltransferase